MKTIKLLAAAALLIVSTSTFANSGRDRIESNKNVAKVISGTPEDINVMEIEALKELRSSKIAYPAIVLPKADDFNFQEIEKLKEVELSFYLPNMIIGTANDININDIEALKEL
jgi:hypothetical protein